MTVVNAIRANLKRLKEELEAVKSEYKTIVDRWQYVTLPFMATRVPNHKLSVGYPKNNEMFHLLTAFVEEFFDKAPRVAAYLFILYFIVKVVLWVL